LTLDKRDHTGGTVSDSGVIHVTGDSAINGGGANNGQLTIEPRRP